MKRSSGVLISTKCLPPPPPYHTAFCLFTSLLQYISSFKNGVGKQSVKQLVNSRLNSQPRLPVYTNRSSNLQRVTSTFSQLYLRSRCPSARRCFLLRVLTKNKLVYIYIYIPAIWIGTLLFSLDQEVGSHMVCVLVWYVQCDVSTYVTMYVTMYGIVHDENDRITDSSV